jgi:hypothetical protein
MGNYRTVRFRSAPHGSGRALEAKLRCEDVGRSLAIPAFGRDASFADWIGPRLTGRRGSVTGTVPDDYPAHVRLLHPVVDEDDVHAWEVAAGVGTRTTPLVQRVPLWSGTLTAGMRCGVTPPRTGEA